MEGNKHNICVKGVSGVDFILYVSAEATDQCVENVAGQVNCFKIAGMSVVPSETVIFVSGEATNQCVENIAGQVVFLIVSLLSTEGMSLCPS